MEGDRIVAVCGATGRQGGAVTRHLIGSGWRVRALTRRPDGQRAKRLRAIGAEVVRADLADPGDLAGAFRDAHGVYSVQNPMTSGVEAEVVQGRNVADAALDAGVRHLVYGSAGTGQAGTGIGSWDSKLAIEAHMAAIGVPVTVLRPMAFMELMTDRRYFPAASTWHVMPKLMGEDRPVGWICVDDLGAVAALAFADPDRFVGADLKLVADVLTISECRQVWREVSGRRPRRLPMPTSMFERFVGTDLTTMWRWLRHAAIELDPAETRRILPSARTVRGWLTEHRTSSNPATS